MSFSRILMAVAAATLLLTGCAKNKAPATKALEQIETSLAAVKDDAAKYAPEGLKGVEAQIDRLKASLDAKEYDNVLAGTPELEKAVATLQDAVASGKEHARAALATAKSEWESLSADVPKMVDTIQARVDTLSKKKMFRGISKDDFDVAKTKFESMKSTWAEAAADAKSGDTVNAASKGKTAKGIGEELLEKLDIKKA